MTTLPAASGCSSASRDQWNTCRTSVSQLLLNVSQVCRCSGRDSGAAPAASTSTRGWWASMSRPAATGSAASAATGVKRSPSCACNSPSLARSRATPTTFAPAPASAMAIPRPKPRLAPVTSAVAPDSSCAGIPNSLILRSERVSPPLPVLIRAVAGTHRRPGRLIPAGPRICTGAGRGHRRARKAGVMLGSEEFARLTEPFRPELLAHCYRMLGSVYDAEDQVQETLVRAWRSYSDFQGRSSLRTWLYRIATNACLRAIENRARRPLPSGLGAPGDDPDGPLAPVLPEVRWLQPIPDALVFPGPADPAAVAVSRESVRLALVAALQYLPGRQRAVLILRDVLGWHAAEVADLLGITPAAANSLLQRARERLRQAAPGTDEMREPADAGQRALLDAYAEAFAGADVGALTKLLREDAVLEMPPQLS